MTKPAIALLAFSAMIFFSCSDFFKDDFKLMPPSSKKFNITFPSLVSFEITQTVTPDQQGLTNEISNTFTITNELNQPISHLKFGINIFDSTDRFQNNLIVSYIDSLQQSLDGFGKSSEKPFNTSFGANLTEDMIEVIILEQDVSDSHPSNGIYVGEAFFYQQPDSIPKNIPYLQGIIDYKGDLTLRASGSEIEDYNISGRLSLSGQFVGQHTSSVGDGVDNLRNKVNTNIVLQGDTLEMNLVPTSSSSSDIDSIIVVLHQN